MTFHLLICLGKTKRIKCLETNNLLEKICSFFERISVFNVIEKLMEHDIHCLPCFYKSDAEATMTSHSCPSDVSGAGLRSAISRAPDS